MGQERVIVCVLVIAVVVEVVVGQVSKPGRRARCDESGRPDFAKTNLILVRLRMWMRVLLMLGWEKVLKIFRYFIDQFSATRCK